MSHTPILKTARSFPRGLSLVCALVALALMFLVASVALANLSTGQTRSKLAQSRVEMRILHRAMEDYHADWNYYPPTFPIGRVFAETQLELTYPYLTTPVAYLSRTGFVPGFGENVTSTVFTGTGFEGERPIYMLFNYYPIVTNDWAWRVINFSGAGDPTDASMVWDCGPDQTDNSLYFCGYATPSSAAAYVDLVYDPSNGVISRGDIGLVGGKFPSLNIGMESQ